VIEVKSKITQQDVDELLREVDSLTNSIGNEIIDSINGQLDTGESVCGRVIKHGNIQYGVQASPGWPHILLESGYNLAEDLAAGRKRARSDGGVQQSPPTQEELSRAKEDLKDHADEDPGDIHLELIEAISNGPRAVKVEADEEFVYGFKIRRRLFAYDREVTVQEYFDEVQSLISAVFYGKNVLQQRYDIESAVSDPSGGPRGYR